MERTCKDQGDHPNSSIEEVRILVDMHWLHIYFGSSLLRRELCVKATILLRQP